MNLTNFVTRSAGQEEISRRVGNTKVSHFFNSSYWLYIMHDTYSTHCK